MLCWVCGRWKWGEKEVKQDSAVDGGQGECAEVELEQRRYNLHNNGSQSTTHTDVKTVPRKKK